MNLYAMFADAVRRHPDKSALAAADRCLTYRDFDSRASEMASRYMNLGCARGDRIVLFLKNSIDYPIFLFAAIRGGFIVVPVNAKLHPDEVVWICDNAQARLLIADRTQLEVLKGVLSSATRCVDPEELQRDNGASIPTAIVDVAPQDPAWLFYTSGTTGKPKGATLTHRNLIAATVNCLADILSFRCDDRVLHVAPLSHASGMYLIPSLARGAENVIFDEPRCDPDLVLDWVANYRITILAFVAPTMIVRLLKARIRSDIETLRAVIYGGSSIHLEHIRAAVNRFGPIFHQLYGQGEAPMTISHLPARDHLDADDDTLLSAGYVRSGVEACILDENDAGLPAGEDGEICVRGDVVMRGYWCNESASAATLRHGWLHTGDIGRFDSAGRLRVMDRRHDTIISGATNIYPKEIEDVIATHPKVREAIAFGVSDREWGESVALALVTETEGCLTESDVIRFCIGRLARFKQPRRVIFLAELPKSAYGKVLRRKLKDQYGK